MKILIYSDYYKKKSGYAKEMRDLIPMFIKAGHQIGYVALGYTGLPVNDNKDIKVYPADVVISSPSGKVSSYFAPEILDYAIDDFKPDIVFTRQDYFALKNIGLVLSRPRGFKWVHWGLVDGEPLGKFGEEPLKWMHEHIFTTEFTKKVVQDINPEAEGEVIMPPINPKDWDVFSEEEKKDLDTVKEKLRNKYGLEKHFTDFIVCVARNQQRKNLPVLFESIKELKKINPKRNPLLMLISHETKSKEGNTAGWDLEHLIRYFGIEENVFIVGRTDDKMLEDNAVADIYSMGDIFALPTMGEGFGLIFGEAMYSGLPIVTTDYSACSEVVKNKGFLVTPNDYVWDTDNVKQAIVSAKEFAYYLNKALNLSKEKKEEMRKEGFDFVSKLTPELVSKKILDIFDKVVEEDKQPLIFKKKNDTKR